MVYEVGAAAAVFSTWPVEYTGFLVGSVQVAIYLRPGGR
jgi:hypothetical protein